MSGIAGRARRLLPDNFTIGPAHADAPRSRNDAAAPTQNWGGSRWLGFQELSCSPTLVTEEDLQALDYLLWFGNGRQAAECIGTHQSTISRRVTQVLAVFDLTLRRRDGHIQITGPNSDLLMRQRLVHQGRRLLGGLPLRLGIGSGALARIESLDLPAWHWNRIERGDPAGQRVLLLEHVLDAWIGPMDATLLPHGRVEDSELTIQQLGTDGPETPLALMVRAEHADHPQIRTLVDTLSQTGTARDPGHRSEH